MPRKYVKVKPPRDEAKWPKPFKLIKMVNHCSEHPNNMVFRKHLCSSPALKISRQRTFSITMKLPSVMTREYQGLWFLVELEDWNRSRSTPRQISQSWFTEVLQENCFHPSYATNQSTSMKVGRLVAQKGRFIPTPNRLV